VSTLKKQVEDYQSEVNILTQEKQSLEVAQSRSSDSKKSQETEVSEKQN